MADLRKRLGPDRRVFALQHPLLESVPLVLVHVALLNDIPSTMAQIEHATAPAEPTTAVFYSISNMQAGVAAMGLGEFLIQQAKLELQQEFRSMTTYCTLSPLGPNFTTWYHQQCHDHAQSPSDEQSLLRTVARYLVQEKDSSSRPLDPVARFHLGNGASLYRINPHAQSPEKNLGLMVNYRYPDDHESTPPEVVHGVSVSPQVRDLLPLNESE